MEAMWSKKVRGNQLLHRSTCIAILTKLKNIRDMRTEGSIYIDGPLKIKKPVYSFYNRTTGK